MDTNQGESFNNAVQESAARFRDYARRIQAERDATGWASLEPTELDSIDAMKMAECLEPMILLMVQQCDPPGEGLHLDRRERSTAVYNRIQQIVETGCGYLKRVERQSFSRQLRGWERLY